MLFPRTPTPRRFRWRNQQRRNLTCRPCPVLRDFDAKRYFAALGPSIDEVVALLEDRRPGAQRSTRPLASMASWLVFKQTWDWDLVPTLKEVVADMGQRPPSREMAIRAIKAWNLLVGFFDALDLAA